MRAGADTTAAIHMLQVFQSISTVIVDKKQLEKNFVPPKSYLSMCKLSEKLWCFMAIIVTPVKSAVCASEAFMQMIGADKQTITANIPAFMNHKAVSGKLDALSLAIQSAINPLLPCSTERIQIEQGRTRNCAVTQAGMVRSNNNPNMSSAQLIQLCARDSPLNPYIALDARTVAIVLRNLPGAESIAAWLDGGTQHILLVVQNINPFFYFQQALCQ